jgi:uncharacterized integral membrane protein
MKMSLDFTALYLSVFQYFHENIYIAIALAGVLLIILFCKPKMFLIVVLIVSILTGALFVISSISNVGEKHKKELVQERTLTLTCPLKTNPEFM